MWKSPAKKVPVHLTEECNQHINSDLPVSPSTPKAYIAFSLKACVSFPHLLRISSSFFYISLYLKISIAVYLVAFLHQSLSKNSLTCSHIVFCISTPPITNIYIFLRYHMGLKNKFYEYFLFLYHIILFITYNNHEIMSEAKYVEKKQTL